MRGRRILSLGLGAMLLGSGLLAGPQAAVAVGTDHVAGRAEMGHGRMVASEGGAGLRSERSLRSVTENLGGDPVEGYTDAAGKAYTGKGQIIVVIDGAFNPQHPMLRGKVVEEACFFVTDWDWKSLCGDNATAWDKDPSVQILTGANSSAVSKDLSVAQCDEGTRFCNNYHGTAAASTAAGRFVELWDDSRYAGAAPGADLILLKIGDNGGWNYRSTRAALRYVNEVLEPKYRGRIAAVNLSSNGPASGEPCSPSVMGVDVAALKRKDIAVTIAAGNTGNDSPVGKEGNWACSDDVYSIGSSGVKELNTFSIGDSASVASKRTALIAPVGSATPGDEMNTGWSYATPELPNQDDRYAVVEGTSFAAPQVAGAFAVLREKFGYSKTVDELVALMRETGVPVADQRPGNTGVVTPRLWLADAIGKRATPAHDFTGNGKADFVFTGVDTSIPVKMTEIDLEADWVGGHDTRLLTGWDWKAHGRIVPVHDYDAPNTNGVITVTGDRLLYHRYNRATNAFAAPQTILDSGASSLRGLTFASQLPHPTTGSGRAVVMVKADGSLVARAKDAYGVGLGAERILLTSMDPVGIRGGTKPAAPAISDTSADGTGQRSAGARSASKDVGSGTADSGADGSGSGARVGKSLAGVSRLVAVTDVNGDGNPDLVTREPGTGAPMVRWGTGSPVTPFQVKTQALSEETYWGDKEQMFVFPATGTTPAHLGYRAPTTGALLHFPFERSGTSWRVSPDYRQGGNWNNTANFRLAPEK